MAEEPRQKHNFLYQRGLTLVALGLFLAFAALQIFTGWKTFDEDEILHGRQGVSLLNYLGESHFWSALFENWESEFLQMGLLVVMSERLRQKGSAQSKKLKGEEGEEEEREQERKVEEQAAREGKTPWPVLKGGWAAKLYENSLFLVLMLIFVLTFIGHYFSSYYHSCQELKEHGKEIPTVLGYLGDPEFWFESMQNWQSEFLSVFAIVVLSIWLRAKDSAESKPVGAAHDYTGH